MNFTKSHILKRSLLRGHRYTSTVPVSKNDLYFEKQHFSLQEQQPHQTSIPSFTDSRVQRDPVEKVDHHDLISPSDPTFHTTMQPLLSYIDMDLGFKELLCIASGMTNMELNLNNNIYQSETLRRLGQTKFHSQLLTNSVFINDRYLTANEAELVEDLENFDNDAILYEFLKWNSLHQFSLINREVLISKRLSQEEFNLKKMKLWKKTSIGSFYTLIGILLVKFKGDVVNELLSDKVINGKRGIKDIVRSKQS
ncbi:hypothetical protein SBY92_002039 [Candida maltosa Xu316]